LPYSIYLTFYLINFVKYSKTTLGVNL